MDIITDKHLSEHDILCFTETQVERHDDSSTVKSA